MEYRVCKVCGEAKEAVKGTWVTRRGKPEGRTCLACHAKKYKIVMRERYTTIAGNLAARLSASRWRKSESGLLWRASDSQRAKDRAAAKVWRRNNKSKSNWSSQRWQKANPYKRHAKAKVARCLYTKGADEMFVFDEAYKLAALRTRLTGIRWVVDHIVPLNGKLVSGLHTINNVQVITELANSIKGNKWCIE